MEDTRRYCAYPSNLNVLACFAATRDYLNSSGFKENSKRCNSVLFRLKVNESRSLYAGDLDEFMQALEQYPRALPVYFHSDWDKDGREGFGLTIDLDSSRLEVSVTSRDLHLISGLHERIRDIFQASNPPVERSRANSRYDVKKTVFLAHRFDDYGKAISGRLETFLRRLGFQVLEGSGYETKDIPDKVSQRIQTQDIFVCVVTPGDSSWILSEASYALGLGKYLIVLCQDGVPFSKGILGQDYEFIPFPQDGIEKAYSDLLYCLPS